MTTVAQHTVYTSCFLLIMQACNRSVSAMRPFTELVQSLTSSSSSPQQRQAAVAELLALPMTPDTWIIAVGAIPALVQMLTLQPAGTRATREVAVQALRHISGYARHVGMVRAAPDGVIGALVPLLLRHSSRDDVAGMVTTTIASLTLNPDNQRQVVEAGAIPPLVQMLKTSAVAVLEAAAIALTYLVSDSAPPSARAEIIAAGAVPPLINVLKSSSLLTALPVYPAFPALVVLKALCYDVEHTVIVAAAGAIPPLIRLLASRSVEMQVEVLQALRYLACNTEIIGPIAAAGAIPPVVKLLSSSMLAVQEHAAAMLSNLVTGRGTHSAVFAAGAIAPLVRLLRRGSPRAKSAAALALTNLTAPDDDAGGRAAVFASGAVAPLVLLLKATGSGNEDSAQAQVHAAMALSHLGSSAEEVALIVRAGAVPPLVGLLPSESVEVQKQAVLTLNALAVYASGHDGFFTAGAILPLLRLTGSSASEEEEEAQKFSLSALLHLSYAPSVPQQFVAAGAIPPLVQMLRSKSAFVLENAVLLLELLTSAESPPAAIAAINSAGAQPLLTRLLLWPSSSFDEGMKIACSCATILERLRDRCAPSSGAAAPASAAPASAAPASTPASFSATAAVTAAATITAFAPASAPAYAPASALALAAATLPSMTASSAPSSGAAASASTLPCASTSPKLAAASPSSAATSQQLPSRPRKSCWSCGATGVPLKKCSGCAVAAYCGVGCQKADWKAHKGQCAGLKAGASGSGSSAAGEREKK